MPKMKNVAKNEIVLHDPYSNALCPPPCVIDIQRPQGCPFIKVSSLFGHYAEFGGAAGGENAWYLQLEFGLFNKKSCPTLHV